MASAILRDTPWSLNEIRSGLPSNILEVIERCLQKKAEDRFPFAKDVCTALRAAPAKSTYTGPLATVSHVPAKSDSGAARADEGFWVAVLPFKAQGASLDLAALADGLSEEIVTGLSRFSYLRVIARGSTAKYSRESGDVRAIGKELGARCVMEGTLRQAGAKLRIAVQLIDAVTGAHLWAVTYDHKFNPEAIFELQDDLVPRIVSTVADAYGVLPHAMSQTVRSKCPC